jgi:DNA modification methylase
MKMRDILDKLRHIEGFPLGEDEDLHALSDPPYYTAYPNPHIAEFIQKYGKPYDEATDDYHREPFVSDISEGKSDPVYMAHAYHTKVPHKAIIPFIEHYTCKGDIVLDAFCGTGMTGLAAQSIARKAILCDLSPAATFLAYNFNDPVNAKEFRQIATEIINKVAKECGWMYQTKNIHGQKGVIKYVVWSDVFKCPYCNAAIVYWDIAVDQDTNSFRDNLSCINCNAEISKRNLEHFEIEVVDAATGEKRKQLHQVPVLINYSIGNKRFEKRPDQSDLDIITKIENSLIPYWFPIQFVPKGDKTGEPLRIGITRVDQFYSKRNLWILSAILARVEKTSGRKHGALKFWLTSSLIRTSKLYKFTLDRKMGNVSGTFFFPSLWTENSPFKLLKSKIVAIEKAFQEVESSNIVTTNSATDLQLLPDNSVDYIFVDPPFGDNLMYSELNFLWESWLKVFTNNKSEAIMNSTQGKKLDDYRVLMSKAFINMYRVLKAGRWITIEFHNSKASVWNAIQEALSKAGFVVAQVTILDKKQGSFNQVTAAGAVKNDLVINAYKPRVEFSQRLISQAGRDLEADFIREHLRQLPKTANLERSKEMLFSKYLGYYVQHGYQVQYNGEQFYHALPKWGFVERDGYWFADEAQEQEYERRKVRHPTKGGKQIAAGQQVLFISDEKSARQWLWGFLNEPKTYDEVYTAFVKALQTSQDQIPELSVMLEEGFVRANGEWKRPDTLTQAELEKRRQERLLRQFNDYLNTARAGQRLKEVRLEAVVAGFTECYRQNRFEDILAVGKKLNKRLIEESADLFDFIDIAEAKLAK